jgi:hypothetical protein
MSGSPESLYVSSPESSPPPSPERSPGVGLPSRGPTNLLNVRVPLASVRYPLVPLRVGRANGEVPAVRPSWLGPNNTGENSEVDFPPGHLTQQQEYDMEQAAAARAAFAAIPQAAAEQSNANTRSAIQAAIQAEYIPPESVPHGVFKSLSTMVPPRPAPSGRGSPAPFGFGRSRPVERTTMFRPAGRSAFTPKSTGGRRSKKTLKRRKTKNNRRRRASKTR